jgi:hypothetical protein
MSHVRLRLLEQFDDVVVVESVVNQTSRAARPDEPRPAHQTKLVRHGGLANPNQGRDIADAQLAAAQRIQNPNAGGIAKHAKDVRERANGLGGHQQLASGGAPTGIEMWRLARFVECRSGWNNLGFSG